IVCSFLFGPAGAWGAAFGNLIGDFFGGLGPGDLFGFVANLAYGFVPYALWDALGLGPPAAGGSGRWAAVGAVIVVASLLCATIVGWGLNWLGFHPFTLLAPLVFVNNLVAAAVLAPVLLRLLYPRIAKARLLYRDLLGPRPPVSRVRRGVGAALLAAGTVGAFATGELVGGGRWQPPGVVVHTQSGAADVGFCVLPVPSPVVPPATLPFP